MASDVRRFVTYLRDASKLGNQQESSPSDGQSAPFQHGNTGRGALRTGIAAVDYNETNHLLFKFKDDHRVRHLLMQTSDEALEEALERVQQQLRDVENISITAYIGEAEPLNDLHTRVS